MSTPVLDVIALLVLAGFVIYVALSAFAPKPSEPVRGIIQVGETRLSATINLASIQISDSKDGPWRPLTNEEKVALGLSEKTT